MSGRVSSNDSESGAITVALDSPLGGRMTRRSFMSRTALVGAAAMAAPSLMAAGPKPGKGPKVTPPPFAVNPLLSAHHRITRHEVAAENAAGKIHTYLARPADVASVPGILVIEENRGLQPYQRDLVDGLASNGYIAVAPDLLSRDGGAGIVSYDDAPGALNGSSSPRHLEDLIATLDLLGNQPGVGPIGVIGFCFGGDLVWRLAVKSPSLGLSAVVPCYGVAPDDVQAAAGNIDAAVLAAYADEDNRVNATREAMLTAMDAAGTTYKTKTYPGTQHAFQNHTREDRYNPEQAQNLWNDALDWFERYLS